MSTPENQNFGPELPAEREFEYLQNAEKAANEAAEPVIQGLANLAIAKAELTANEPDDALFYASIIAEDAGKMSEGASKIGDEAEAFAHANDYAFDENVNTDTADGAERFLREYTVEQYRKHEAGEDTDIAFRGLNDQSNEKAYMEMGKGFTKAKYGIPVNYLLSENEKTLLDDNSPQLDKPR